MTVGCITFKMHFKIYSGGKQSKNSCESYLIDLIDQYFT